MVIVGACPWDRSRLREVLEEANFEVLGEASDVKQTLEFINRFSDIGLILSELELKCGDGLELASALVNRIR